MEAVKIIDSIGGWILTIGFIAFVLWVMTRD